MADRAYEIFLAQKAENDLAAMPPWLPKVVESWLLKLGQRPSAFSRAVVSPPFPPGGMMSEFDHGPIDGANHHVAIFFRYSQDETTLVVDGIGHTEQYRGLSQ